MTRTCLAVGVAALLSSAVVQAHHGTNASYDPKKEAFNQAIRNPAGCVVK